MFSAILAIMLLSITDLGKSKGLQFRLLSTIIFWGFVTNLFILMILGGCHVESPFIEVGQISTCIYFGYFILVMPVVSSLENIFTLSKLKPKLPSTIYRNK
jgi:ubiquinol-cytochrome c reductase cytochrome b subunit